MVIQHLKHGGLRTITQHEHGVLSGELAHHWRGEDGERPSLACVLAVTLHDLCWERLDRPDLSQQVYPPFDSERGLPYDFLSMPTDKKAVVYEEGIAHLRAIDLWAGLLLNLHFTAFLPGGKNAHIDGLIESSRRERQELAQTLGLDGVEDELLQRDFSRLKFFDLISLFICMTGFGAHTETLPPWLHPPFELFGQRFELSWIGEGRLRVQPFYFDQEPLRLTYHSKSFERTSFGDAEHFAKAWTQAKTTKHQIALVP